LFTVQTLNSTFQFHSWSITCLNLQFFTCSIFNLILRSIQSVLSICRFSKYSQ
jgi:hypothetical protein